MQFVCWNAYVNCLFWCICEPRTCIIDFYCSPNMYRHARGRHVRHQAGDHSAYPQRRQNGHSWRRGAGAEDLAHQRVYAVCCLHCGAVAQQHCRRKRNLFYMCFARISMFNFVFIVRWQPRAIGQGLGHAAPGVRPLLRHDHREQRHWRNDCGAGSGHREGALIVAMGAGRLVVLTSRHAAGLAQSSDPASTAAGWSFGASACGNDGRQLQRNGWRRRRVWLRIVSVGWWRRCGSRRRWRWLCQCRRIVRLTLWPEVNNGAIKMICESNQIAIYIIKLYPPSWILYGWLVFVVHIFHCSNDSDIYI